MQATRTLRQTQEPRLENYPFLTVVLQLSNADSSSHAAPRMVKNLKRFEKAGFRSHNFLAQLLSETSTACTIRVRRSTSEVEREFAKRLNEREDIRLFLKLPSGFEIDTPVGKYNPDWAIVKHEDETLYLVRETKSTKDFLKLRTAEADKVRCGEQHFKALEVPFAVVVDDTGV